MGFWSALTSAVQTVGNFARDHWREIAVVAASTVVFAGVLVLTGGTAALLAPTLLQLAVAGVASGAAGQILGDVLEGNTPTLAGVGKAALIGGVITVATAGLGRFIPGLSRPLQNQIAQKAVITAAGSGGGAGAQIMSNAMDGQPLLANVPTAALKGGLATLAASEGIRVAAPRIVNAVKARTRAREALPEPEPVVAPRLTLAEAEVAANQAAVTLAKDLRSPDGIPLKGALLKKVSRGVSADTDVVTGETTTGVTAGPLNGKLARALAAEGYDLAAIEATRNVAKLKEALRNPNVAKELDPRIVKDILARPDSDFIMTGENGQPFLALPWNCAEVQALNAALAKGSKPENLVADTVTARENNPLNAGRPFKCCPNCANLLRRLGVHNASDARIAANNLSGTVTSDTTAPADLAPPTKPESKGFAKAVQAIGE